MIADVVGQDGWEVTGLVRNLHRQVVRQAPRTGLLRPQHPQHVLAALLRRDRLALNPFQHLRRRARRQLT